MAEVTSHAPGAFCWVELATTDQKAAKDFYTKGARTYVPPSDVPGMGRFAVLADPQDATFAIYRE